MGERDRYGNPHYEGPDAVLVGDTYVSPAGAAEYAQAESEALGGPADSCEGQDEGDEPGGAVMDNALGNFEARQSSDDVKTDLELTCTKCGEHLCDIEAGDTLETLVMMATGHRC